MNADSVRERPLVFVQSKIAQTSVPVGGAAYGYLWI